MMDLVDIVFLISLVLNDQKLTIVKILMPSQLDLLHYRLQAIMRDYNMPDLEYLGERKSWKSGEMVHWYKIGEAEVPIDAITEFEAEETNEED